MQRLQCDTLALLLLMIAVVAPPAATAAPAGPPPFDESRVPGPLALPPPDSAEARLAAALQRLTADERAYRAEALTVASLAARLDEARGALADPTRQQFSARPAPRRPASCRSPGAGAFDEE